MKSLKTTARLIGLGYLIIFISGFFANFYTLESIVVDGNAHETAQNIASQIGLFQLGVLSFSLMILVDVFLAFPLYYLLKNTSDKCAKVSSVIRVINGLVFIIALINLFEIITITQSDNGILETQAMSLLDSFSTFWNIGLLFFGVHLLMLGSLVVQSVYFPKIIGLLLQIAGLAYLADSGAQLFLGEYESYRFFFEAFVIISGVVGEFSFTIWLLIKGVRNVEKLGNSRRVQSISYS